MRDDGRTAVDLGHQTEIDGKCELHLLTLAQTEVLGLDEDAVRAQVFRLANPAFSSRHHDVYRSPRSVAGMQATLHRYQPLRLMSLREGHYAHRNAISEALRARVERYVQRLRGSRGVKENNHALQCIMAPEETDFVPQ